MEIPDIDIGIREVSIPEIYIGNQETPIALPIYPPVTTQVGVPIIDIPGCVEAHEQNTNREKSGILSEDDPKGVKTFCDAGVPSFGPLDYNKDKLKFEQEAPVPPVRSPETPPAPKAQTKTPKIPKDPPCPPPNAPRIGDIAQSGKEKVSGFELQKNPQKTTEKICVTLYEPVTIVEKYLPPIGTVTTTASIAAVAATSALLAKPLADLLLKIVKPTVKKAIGAVKKKLGKTEPLQSLRDRRDQQRQKTQAIRALRQMVKK